MVYFSPNIDQDDEINFSSLNNATEPAVVVKFNGTGLHEIAGPVPFVNLAKTYNRNQAGIIENIQTNVTINGKIVRATDPNFYTSGRKPPIPPGTGVQAILGAIKKIQELFQCTAGFFEVKCSNQPPDSGISISGARVNSFSINRSDDNWFFTADYQAELEYNEPGITGLPPVRNTVDSWSIEPLEDYIYTNFNVMVQSKAEYHNPDMKPTAPLASARVPPEDGQSARLDIVNIPQYKISRRLSAVGFPVSSSGTGCFSPTGNHTAYLEAKKWVELKLHESFKPPANVPSGAIALINTGNGLLSDFSKMFLFNHLRTINFSISEGSYELNDTWLAMPTGMMYVEDYNIETNTDEKYIKTVRVAGNIKGLSFTPIGIMSGGSGVLPTGLPPTIIDLGFSYNSGVGPFATNRKVPDQIMQDSPLTNNFFGNKYLNALSGWVYDIKPYLYRRASLVLNNGSRADTYLSPTNTPPPAPKNPIYCKENLLNIIPISTSEGHDPRKGTISYTYEYSNRFVFISGALSENVTINDTGPTDVVNETFVLGRRLGPILQSLGSRTAAKRDLTIEVTVLPPSSLAGFVMTNKDCPLWTGGTVFNSITGMIEGLKPFGDRTVSIFGNMGDRETRTGGALNNQGQVYINMDNQTWNPVEGRYTRQIGWTYQACTTSRSHMDI